MQERWNHPCVVIWDAQNETVTAETGKAVAPVRGLDLSDRPWDNGYGLPGDLRTPSRPIRTWPAMRRSAWPTRPMTGEVGQPKTPQGNARPNEGGNPVIINEYGWMWLNRDGTPTTLSQESLRPDCWARSTAAQRRRTYARWLAAKTEFGVAPARGRGAALLRPGLLPARRPDQRPLPGHREAPLDPDFQRYVGDAFAPVGLMIDFWADGYSAGRQQRSPSP